MNQVEPEKYQYLIIGGTTKAATTSLFRYLADHPEVSASKLKETRFFIDEDYPIQPQDSTWKDGIEKFHTLFNSQKHCLRVEATPDYLYSKGTPQRIKDLLPSSRIVFILRDPVSRIISWYKYSQQIGAIAKSMTFDLYIEKQLKGGYFENAKKKSMANKSLARDVLVDYSLSALEHGCYATYLQSYIDILGSEKVRVYFYEELCTQPCKVIVDLCNFASLSPSFYDKYDFQVFNRSVSIKSRWLNLLYSEFRQSIRRRTYNMPIHQTFRRMRLRFDRIYYRINSSKAEAVKISPAMRKKLDSYYEADIRQLECMLCRSVPWRTRKAE